MATQSPTPSSSPEVTESGGAIDREITVEYKDKVEFGQNEVYVGHNAKGEITTVVNPDGSVTYRKSADASYEVGAGVDGKIAGIEGNLAAGASLEYQITVPQDSAAAIDPGKVTLEGMATADVPVGTKLSLDVARYGSAELAGYYKELAAEVNVRDAAGVGIAVEKTGANRVRVTVGPTSALDLYAGAGVRFGDDAKLLLGVASEGKQSKFKSAEFDLSTDEGRKAYEEFTRTGTIPLENSKDGKSVTGVCTIETKDDALELGVKFEAEIKSQRPRADGSIEEIGIKSETEWSLAKNSNADVVTTYADGSKEIVGSRTLTGALVPDSSTEIRQKIDKDGNREETLVSKSGDPPTPWLIVKGNFAKDGSGESLRAETRAGTTVEVAKKFGPSGVEDTAERRYTITLPADDAAALNAAFGKQGQPSTVAEDGKNVVITLTEAEAAQWQKMARDAGSAMTSRQLQDFNAINSAYRDPNQTTEQFIAELTSGPHGYPRDTVRNLAKISEMAGSEPKYRVTGEQIESVPSHTQLPGTLNAGEAQNRAAAAPTTTQTQAPSPATPAQPAAPPAPTARTAADRAHPDNALLEKTTASVRELDRSIGKPWDGDSERLSASAFKMAVAMNFKPGDDIAVGVNRPTAQHAAGELLMVHRHGANASPDPSANHASMPLAEALAKPADQRLQEADTIRQGQGAEAQRQQEQHTREQETRSAKAPAAP